MGFQASSKLHFQYLSECAPKSSYMHLEQSGSTMDWKFALHSLIHASLFVRVPVDSGGQRSPIIPLTAMRIHLMGLRSSEINFSSSVSGQSISQCIQPYQKVCITDCYSTWDSAHPWPNACLAHNWLKLKPDVLGRHEPKASTVHISNTSFLYPIDDFERTTPDGHIVCPSLSLVVCIRKDRKNQLCTFARHSERSPASSHLALAFMPEMIMMYMSCHLIFFPR